MNETKPTFARSITAIALLLLSTSLAAARETPSTPGALEARRQKALTSLEQVRWTQYVHRFEEDVRNLELRAPREEAPARKTTSTRFRRRRCKSEGLKSFTYRRTRSC